MPSSQFNAFIMQILQRKKERVEHAMAQIGRHKEGTDENMLENKNDPDAKVMKLLDRGDVDDYNALQALQTRVIALPPSMPAVDGISEDDEYECPPFHKMTTASPQSEEDSKLAANPTTTAQDPITEAVTKKRAARKASRSRQKNDKKKAKATHQATTEFPFAVRKIGKYGKYDDILAIDDGNSNKELASFKWEFQLVRRLKEIDTQLGEAKGIRKYYVVGYRDPTNAIFFRHLGLGDKDEGELENVPVPCEHGNVPVPDFMIHVVESTMEHKQVFSWIDGKEGNVFVTSLIGAGTKHQYQWQDVALDGLTVKVSVSTWRESANSSRKMSAEQETLAESANVWFPAKVDVNTCNPFAMFILSVGNDTLVVDQGQFKRIRRELLNALIDKKEEEDPDWLAGGSRMDKKQHVWNEIIFAESPSLFVERMMHPMMVDGILFWFEEELDGIEDACGLVTAEAKRALQEFHPKLVSQMEESHEYGELTKSCKHFKVYPENPELQRGFLHGNHKAINEWLGTAEDVFPRAVGTTNEVDSQPSLW